ncbi:MAG TPA: ribose-phosphate pyrophosphokinase [Gemmataceae bacterium]|nr:ribose-phosphate pyrophosphokinase [Gemmataceae bacterium]
MSSPIKWKLLSGNSHPALAQDLAGELNVPLEPVTITTFADGETSIRITGDVRDALVFIVQPTSPPVAEHLLTLALLIDAARAAGAYRIVALVPYFGYARQEQRGHPGEPRSAQVAARLLAAVGLNHLVTLDLHAPALESAFPMPITQLRAEEAFLPRLREWKLPDLTIVAPDAGGLKRAQRYASAMNADLAVITKFRPRLDVAAHLQVLGDVKGRTCLLVDDMASTGRTLAGAAEALRDAGAREVHAVFTHAVMAPESRERLLSAPLGRIVTSDSIPIAEHPRCEVVRIVPLLARAVRDLSGETTG